MNEFLKWLYAIRDTWNSYLDQNLRLPVANWNLSNFTGFERAKGTMFENRYMSRHISIGHRMSGWIFSASLLHYSAAMWLPHPRLAWLLSVKNIPKINMITLFLTSDD